MRHLMQVVPPGGKVLDPFAGGGATLVAAHQMGLNAVGIEKTEANYKTAAARIAELLPPPPVAQQGGRRPTAAPRLYPCRVGWYSSLIQQKLRTSGGAIHFEPRARSSKSASSRMMRRKTGQPQALPKRSRARRAAAAALSAGGGAEEAPGGSGRSCGAVLTAPARPAACCGCRRSRRCS